MSTRPASLRVAEPAEGPFTVVLDGDWRGGEPLASVRPAAARIATLSPPARVVFEAGGIGRWDSALIVAVRRLEAAAAGAGVSVDRAGLPAGAQQMLALAEASDSGAPPAPASRGDGFLAEIGLAAIRIWQDARHLLAFLGNLTLAAGRFVTGRAVYDRRDLLIHLKQTGSDALPIVSLISFLVGVIFAFVGVMQLEPFGAGIYVADLVAVAMVREMAAIMTAIIMAGRSGAAFAAELGTMKVNEEIDALRTLGLNVTDYLVLPRAIALILMVPLLTLYASLMGIVGGLVAAVAMMDVSLVQYVEQTKGSVGLNSLMGGLFKSFVYAVMVAVAGCQQGLACGGSALAVGRAATSAVVMAIVLIVVSAAILTVIYTTIGI